LVLDTGLGVTVWGVTIHLWGDKTDNLGTYNNSTTARNRSNNNRSNQMVLGTTGSSLSVLIPSTNTSALIVSGGVSVGASLGVNGTNRQQGDKYGNIRSK
jgi:hypothetical protein